MELGPTEIEKAKQLANEGKTIAQISEELEVDYWLLWSHVRSWQGTKQIITRRLNRLINEQDQSARKQLVSEVVECVDYFYYQGKRLGSQVERARKVLNN